MAADRGDLGRGQTHLKEAADGLMAEIVEVEVGAAGSPAYAFPGQPKGVGGHWENHGGYTREFPKHL
jgi:hypothetical protein